MGNDMADASSNEQDNDALPTPSQQLRARGWDIIDDDLLDADPTVMDLTTIEQIRALNDPMRMRLLGAIGRRPESAKGLAERFGVPTTRLYHHLGLLEQHGFIEVVATRRSGARTERCYGMRPRSSLRPTTALTQTTDRRAFAEAVSAVVEMAAASLAEAIVADRVDFEEEPGTAVISSSMMRLTEEQQRTFTQEFVELHTRMSAASSANADLRLSGVDPGDEPVQILVVLAPDVLAPPLPDDA